MNFVKSLVKTIARGVGGGGDDADRDDNGADRGDGEDGPGGLHGRTQSVRARPDRSPSVARTSPWAHEEDAKKIQRLWRGYAALSSEEKISCLSELLPVFCSIYHDGTLPELREFFADSRNFSFTVARRLVSVVRSATGMNYSSKDDGARALATLLSTSGKSPMVWECLVALRTLTTESINGDASSEAALPSTLVRVIVALHDAPEVLRERASLEVTPETQLPYATAFSRAHTLEHCLTDTLLNLVTYAGAAVTELTATDTLSLLFRLLAQPGTESQMFLRERVHNIVKVILQRLDRATVDHMRGKGVLRLLITGLDRCEEFRPEAVVALLSTLVTLLSNSTRFGAGLLDEFASLKGYNLMTKIVLWMDSLEDTTGMEETVRLVTGMTYVGTEDLPPKLKKSPFETGTFPAAETGELNDMRVRNQHAFSVLQTAFLAAQKEASKTALLDCIFGVYATHRLNYFILADLPSVALFMEHLDVYPEGIRERILKIVEFIACVCNSVPFQELLTVCRFLQDRKTAGAVFSVFDTILKLIAYDPLYKHVLREVGFVDLLSLIVNDFGAEAGRRVAELNAPPPRTVNRNSFPPNSISVPTADPNVAAATLSPTGEAATGVAMTLTPPTPTANLTTGFTEGSAGATAAAATPVRPQSVAERQAALSSGGKRQRTASIIADAVTKQVVSRAEEGVEGAQEDLVKYYSRVMQCTAALLEQDATNIQIFRESRAASYLPALLYEARLRPHALRVILHLIAADKKQEHRELAALVELSNAAGRSQFSVGLRIDILDTIRKAFELNVACRDRFCEVGGFLSLVHIITSLENMVARDPAAPITAPGAEDEAAAATATEGSPKPAAEVKVYESSARQAADLSATFHLLPEEEERLTLLLSAFKTLVAGVAQHYGNRVHMRKNVGYNTVADGIRLTGLLQTPLASRVLELVADLATEATEAEKSDPSSVMIIKNPSALSIVFELLAEAPVNTQRDILTQMTRLALSSCRNIDAFSTESALAAVLSLFQRQFADEAHPLHTVLLDYFAAVGTSRLSPGELRQFLDNLSPDRAVIPQTLVKKLVEMACANTLRVPPFVEFNMRLGGFACVVTSSLGDRSWPPTNGYTFAAWICIEYSSQQDMLRLFHLVSDDQKCSTLGFIQDGTLCVYTSTRNNVAFKSVSFRPHRWYHVVVVHARGRIQSSTCSLYLDGTLRETQRLAYPAASSHKVACYLGTPASHRSDSRLFWRLGPCYLLDEIISGQDVAMLFKLSTHYAATFQGDLEDFFTNEMVDGRPNEDGSIDMDHSNLKLSLSVDRIVVAYNARAVRTINNTQTTDDGSNAIVAIKHLLNTAANSGLPQARLAGGTACFAPADLAESLRKVGGLPIVLAILERAGTTDKILDAVQLLVAVVQHHPKSTAEMERLEGYHIVACFLKDKAHLLDVAILDVLYALVGQNNGVIANKTAFEAIFLNHAIWSKVDVPMQKLMLTRLGYLITESESHVFNIHRLREFGIFQRLLDQLNDESYPEELVDDTVFVLGVLLRDDPQPDDLIGLVYFLIATLNTSYRGRKREDLGEKSRTGSTAGLASPPPSLPTGRAKSSSIMSNNAIATMVSKGGVKRVKSATILAELGGHLTRNARIRNKVLKMLADALSRGASSDRIHEALAGAAGVTWLFNFLDQNVHPSTVVLATMIVTSMLMRPTSTFAEKFKRHNIGGFKVMSHLLPNYADIPSLYVVLLSLLLGQPLTSLRDEQLFTFEAILGLFKIESDSGKHPLYAPEALHVILNMLRTSCSQVLVAHSRSEAGGAAATTTAPASLSASGGSTSVLNAPPPTSPTPSLLMPGVVAEGGKGKEDAGEEGPASPGLDASAPAANLFTNDTDTQMALLKFIMHLFAECQEFQEVWHRGEYLDELVEVLFPRYHIEFDRHAPTNLRVVHALSPDNDSPRPGLNVDTNPTATSSPPTATAGATGDDAAVTVTPATPAATAPPTVPPMAATTAAPAAGAPASTSPPMASAGPFRDRLATRALLRDFYGLQSRDQVMMAGDDNDPLAQPERDAIAAGVLAEEDADQPANPSAALAASGSVTSPTAAATSPPPSVLGSPVLDAQFSPRIRAAPVEDRTAAVVRMFQHPTAVLLFDLIRHIVVTSLRTSAKGFAVVEAVFETIPARVPPEYSSLYQAKVLSDTITELRATLTKEEIGAEQRLQANLARFVTFAVDKVFQRTFPYGGGIVLDFLGFLVDMMLTDNSTAANVQGRKVNTQIKIAPFFRALNRVALNRLALAQHDPAEALNVMNRIMFYQNVLLHEKNNDDEFFACFVHHLCTFLRSNNADLKDITLRMLKLLVMERRDMLSDVLRFKTGKESTVDLVGTGFVKLLERDAEFYAFRSWFDDFQETIKLVMDNTVSLQWTRFETLEQRTQAEALKASLVRRAQKQKKRERAKQIELTHQKEVDMRRSARILSIQAADAARKKKRAVAEQDREAEVRRAWPEIYGELTRERGVWGTEEPNSLDKWVLDRTEGPFRMRRKLERNPRFYEMYPYRSEKDVSGDGGKIPTSRDSELHHKAVIERAQGLAATPQIAPKEDNRLPNEEAELPAPETTEDGANTAASGAGASAGTSGGAGAAADPAVDVVSTPASTGLDATGVVEEDGAAAGAPAGNLNLPSGSPGGKPKSREASPAPAERNKGGVAPPVNNTPPQPAAPPTTLPALNTSASAIGIKEAAPPRTDGTSPTPGTTTATTDAPAAVTPSGGAPRDPSTPSLVRTQSAVDAEEYEMVTESEVNAASSATAGGTGEDFEGGSKEKPEDILMRRLDPEDEIVSRHNCSRIVGLDSTAGVLLLSKLNMYIIDGYMCNDEGIIVDIPPQMDHGVPVNAPITHDLFCWSFEEVREIHKRRYLLRDVAMEIFSRADGTNHLVTFDKADTRDDVYNDIFRKIAGNTLEALGVVALGSSAVGSEVDPKRARGIGGVFAKGATAQWQAGEMSNFQYLMHLNTLAGRSYNDLTQYPVFPWILCDYTSATIDLKDPKVYRDLTKPMGAMGERRAREFRERYEAWDDPEVPPFHYGTHYSSAGMVLYYLIRLEPFTQHFLKLQGGKFDHPDRLFHSVAESWESASQNNMSDVKELIPEFFYQPEFLKNQNAFDFGLKWTGVPVNDIILPPWAHGDPQEFIRINRMALESDIVSAQLHHWIDLIFGYAQQGPAAVEKQNMFYHLTYEGAVDIDEITDPVIKAATIAQINNFGQTPKQLFKKPHAARALVAPSPTVYSHPEALLPSASPIRALGERVGELRLVQETVFCVGAKKILVMPNCKKYIAYGFPDFSLREVSHESNRVLGVHDNMHDGQITAVCMTEDGKILVTGAVDSVVNVWSTVKKHNVRQFSTLARLCGHRAAVTCLQVSRAYSIIVSGARDGTIIIWDLNRLRYVRQLSQHPGAVVDISINHLTGDIITATAMSLYVWTINGTLLVNKRIVSKQAEAITTTTVSLGPEWLESNAIVTGHRDGSIQFWSFVYDVLEDDGTPGASTLRRDLEHRHRLAGHADATCKDPGVSALLMAPDGKRLFSGDMEGHVMSWSLPEAGSNSEYWLRDEAFKVCPGCTVQFGVLERRHHCRLCGSVFCNMCTRYRVALGDPGSRQKPARVCRNCFERRQEKEDAARRLREATSAAANGGVGAGV